MNKYYYIINLFDSIDRLFLFTYYSTAYYFAIIGFILFIVAVIASIPVYIYKKLKDTVCFYIVMSVSFAFTSTVLIGFIAVPLNIYLAQLAMILPDSPNLSKKIVTLITVISIMVSIAFSVLTISGVLVWKI